MSKNIFVSVDMEGLTGAVMPAQVVPGRIDYERFRKVMVREANAAVEGAFQAGADRVLVNDSHDGMLNLKIEELDPRAELISGYHKSRSMMEGVDHTFACVFFIGYHSMASGPGVLSHTMTGIVSKAYLNETPASEGVLNAMLAGYYNVSVGLVCGDQYAVAEVKRVCPDAEVVEVKNAIDRYSAESKPLREVEGEISEKAASAVKRAAQTKPFKPSAPIRITVEYTQPSIAKRASMVPFVKFIEPRTIQTEGRDGLEAYTAFRAALLLANTAHDADYD